eukprot:6189050-Pleurochrysis_carterae.AAC.1
MTSNPKTECLTNCSAVHNGALETTCKSSADMLASTERWTPRVCNSASLAERGAALAAAAGPDDAGERRSNLSQMRWEHSS